MKRLLQDNVNLGVTMNKSLTLNENVYEDAINL